MESYIHNKAKLEDERHSRSTLDHEIGLAPSAITIFVPCSLFRNKGFAYYLTWDNAVVAGLAPKQSQPFVLWPRGTTTSPYFVRQGNGVKHLAFQDPEWMLLERSACENRKNNVICSQVIRGSGRRLAMLYAPSSPIPSFRSYITRPLDH